MGPRNNGVLIISKFLQIFFWQSQLLANALTGQIKTWRYKYGHGTVLLPSVLATQGPIIWKSRRVVLSQEVGLETAPMLYAERFLEIGRDDVDSACEGSCTCGVQSEHEILKKRICSLTELT